MEIRRIVFRGKRTDTREWVYGSLLLWPDGDANILESKDDHTAVWKREIDPDTAGQYTGLKDKDNKSCIYEGDILSLDGQVIGNIYENKGLLKDGTNLLIERICTEKWLSTIKEAIKRGCLYAK